MKRTLTSSKSNFSLLATSNLLSHLADTNCENAGIVAESLGKLNLDEGAEMLVVSLNKLTALRKLDLRGTV